MELDIAYDDDNYLIVNKTSGLLVHSTAFHEEDTLAASINYYSPAKNNKISDVDNRRGICHSLDKDTGGLLIVAKTTKVQNILMDLIKNKSVKKRIYCNNK